MRERWRMKFGAHGVTRPTYSCYPRNPWLNLVGREGLLFLAEFFKAQIAAQRIPFRV